MSQPEMTDIWITGAAAVTALGEDLASTWEAVLAGRTAGRWADLHTLAGKTVRVPAVPIDWPILADVPLEISSVRSERLAREVARQVVCDARLGVTHQQQAAVVFGSSKPSVCTWFIKTVLEQRWPADVAGPDGSDLPDYMPKPTWDTLTPQRAATVVSEVLQTEGPILSSISACSTGLHSIIRAAQWLQDGGSEIAIAGAVESGLNPLFAASFSRMRVLADRYDDPATACRPFDTQRCGFTIGEGAGALILETPQHARARGARPIAVISSYGRGADPTGLADMDPQGRPMAGVIRRCLGSANVRPEQVACIKAHGTATQQNDRAEAAAIQLVFGRECPPVISLKGHLGHCLGASGAIEMAICTRVAATGTIPVTANLTCPDPQCPVNHPRAPMAIFSEEAEHMLCLSAGFGGHLAAVLVRRPRATDC